MRRLKLRLATSHFSILYGLLSGVLLILSCVLLDATGSASAADVSVGKIKISKLWSRATPGGARVGAGYLTIRNLGNRSDKLISGSSKIAERIEVHVMRVDAGIMRMRRLAQGLEIGPSETIEFRPGGYHLMFIGLKKTIVKGDSIKVTLVFEGAGEVQVTFVAEGIGSPGPR